jgi:hypothetical protein
MPPTKKKKGPRFGRDEPNKNLIHHHTTWYKNEQRRIQREREQEQIQSEFIRDVIRKRNNIKNMFLGNTIYFTPKAGLHYNWYKNMDFEIIDVRFLHNEESKYVVPTFTLVHIKDDPRDPNNFLQIVVEIKNVNMITNKRPGRIARYGNSKFGIHTGIHHASVTKLAESWQNILDADYKGQFILFKNKIYYVIEPILHDNGRVTFILAEPIFRGTRMDLTHTIQRTLTSIDKVDSTVEVVDPPSPPKRRKIGGFGKTRFGRENPPPSKINKRVTTHNFEERYVEDRIRNKVFKEDRRRQQEYEDAIENQLIKMRAMLEKLQEGNLTDRERNFIKDWMKKNGINF